MQSQRRGRVGAGNFSVSPLACRFPPQKMQCFQAHLCTVNSWSRVSSSTECKQPLSEAIRRLRRRCKAVQAPLQIGEITHPSRLDQPAGWIVSFLLRTRLIGVHHARGEILSEREAVKTEGSGYWPTTSTYNLDCYYATELKDQDLQRLIQSSNSGLIPDFLDRWDLLGFTVLAQEVSPRVRLGAAPGRLQSSQVDNVLFVFDKWLRELQVREA